MPKFSLTIEADSVDELVVYLADSVSDEVKGALGNKRAATAAAKKAAGDSKPAAKSSPKAKADKPKADKPKADAAEKPADENLADEKPTERDVKELKDLVIKVADKITPAKVRQLMKEHCDGAQMFDKIDKQYYPALWTALEEVEKQYDADNAGTEEPAMEI